MPRCHMGCLERSSVLTLKLKSGKARRMCGHEIRTVEPHPQRHPRTVHDGPCCDRGLMFAFRALNAPIGLDPVSSSAGTALRTHEPLRPAALVEIIYACLFVRKPPLELQNRRRKWDSSCRFLALALLRSHQAAYYILWFPYSTR